jgi:hypothetical protein
MPNSLLVEAAELAKAEKIEASAQHLSTMRHSTFIEVTRESG